MTHSILLTVSEGGEDEEGADNSNEKGPSELRVVQVGGCVKVLHEGDVIVLCDDLRSGEEAPKGDGSAQGEDSLLALRHFPQMRAKKDKEGWISVERRGSKCVGLSCEVLHTPTH